MDTSNSNGALSPSNSSRPYPTTASPSDEYSHRYQQQQQQHPSRPLVPAAGVRSSAHHPMSSGSAPGSAEHSLSGSAPSRRHNYGGGYQVNASGNVGDAGAGAHADAERRGHLRRPSSAYRSHDFAHVRPQEQQQLPPYQHAYSDPALPMAARFPAASPSNPTTSPPPPARRPFPAHPSARAPLPGYASPLSPINRFHPSPYAPTVSSGPSPAQSAPRSAGLNDVHTMRGVTQTPNWPTQASYTPNSVFSSYPNTPARVGEIGGGGGGPGSGGPAAAGAGYLSTTPVAHTPAHHELRGQGADGNVADDEDFDGIPPGHVHVDAWGPQGPPAHVREMMRRRPMFEGGRVQPASPPKRYLGVERAPVDVDRPHRQAELDGMRSPMDGVRPPVGMSAKSPAGLGDGAGNIGADTSDWTMSEHNEFDAESVTNGPSGTVRRAYTSTTHTVTHRHHHHHRPQDAQELLHVPPSAGGSSTAAIAATNDPMDVASPTGGSERHHFPQHQQHRLDADESEDDWSESKTTVTHRTTMRRAPQHHHQAHAHNQALEQVRGQAIGSPIGSPNAVVEDTMPLDQGDEKHPFAQFTDPRLQTSSSRERDMPAPPPYYDGAIPPPPPSHPYHGPLSSTSARRSGPAAPPAPAGPGSNSANVYFGNRRGGYFEDDRHPPPGMAASRAYWSDRERMMLMVDRDRADRDRYYRGSYPVGAGYYPSSYPPPPPTLPPPPPRGGQFDVEVRHMAAEYPPRMPPAIPAAAPASALPSMDEYERRAWAMRKRHDGLADGVDERDRVRYEGAPPPMDARAPGYRSPMPPGRGRYWGGSPHELLASTSTRFHQHPAGYHRSYEEFMYEQREREYSAAMMDRGRGVGGGYDRMERGMMPPPPPPAGPVGPSPPIMGVSRGGEPSEWAAPRTLDAQSEGPPPYDVGSWQEPQRRGSPQRASAGGRRASHLSGGALGPIDPGHYGPRPDGWRHPSQFPPVDTQSMSASSQTAHASASASASPQRHDTDAYELPHNRPPNNAAPAVRRPHPPPQPLRVAQAPASSAAAPVSHPVTPVHSVPDTPLLQLGPNMGTTSVGLAIMAAIDEGDIGKRRDYLTFTRSTYTEMIECLRRPNDPLAPHITDRRRWKRLMNLLVEHPGQPTYQSLTWKQCPLWIVPHEDWDQLIWEYHYANGQPGLAECNTVAKTARMLGRLYQTRRSRCGIFIEYIAQLLAMCPHCAGGEEGAKIMSKAKGKITIGQQVVQLSQTGESEGAGVGGQGSAASASATASGGAGTGSSQPTSEGADVAAPYSPRSPLDQQAQQPFVLAPDGGQGQQAPRTSPPRPPAHVYLPFSYLPGLPLDAAHLEPNQGQQPPASASASAARDPSNSPPSSGASQRMLVDGESDGDIGSQQHDPLFSDPPPDPHVVFQDRR